MILFSENSKIPEEYADYLNKLAAYAGEEETFKEIIQDTMSVLRSLMKTAKTDAEVLERASLNGIINDLNIFKEMVSDHANLARLKTAYMDELNALHYTINDIFRQL